MKNLCANCFAAINSSNIVYALCLYNEDTGKYSLCLDSYGLKNNPHAIEQVFCSEGCCHSFLA